jgi:hypothetical protein
MKNVYVLHWFKEDKSDGSMSEGIWAVYANFDVACFYEYQLEKEIPEKTFWISQEVFSEEIYENLQQ